MGFYNAYILPWRLARGMDNASFEEDRRAVVSHSHGVVLEIGFGSGLNLSFYPKGVTKVYALDPSKELFAYAKDRITQAPFDVEYICGGAEKIPLPDNSIDAVISTWTLCSIEDPLQTLKEISRVLKPGAVFSFAEHGKSPHPIAHWLQNLFTPFTRRYDGNCHLNRDIPGLIKTTFTMKELIASREPYVHLSYDYRGVAIKPE